MGGGNYAGGQGRAEVHGGFGERSLPACTQQSQSRVFSAALYFFLTVFSVCLLEGPWPRTLVWKYRNSDFRKKPLPGFSQLMNTLLRCVFFSEIFLSDLGGFYAWVWPWGSLTLGFSDFYLSYLAPTTFPETHDGFARNNGIEMNVWTGHNHFSVRKY